MSLLLIRPASSRPAPSRHALIRRAPARRRLVPRALADVLLALAVLAGGCERASAPFGDSTATQPVAAVQQLVDDLRRDDLAAYARHAVPAPLHARLEIAWAEGRTVWPLTELPLDRQFGGFITTLAAPGSEQKLLATYRRQFAGAHGELKTAATTLGLFATQYVSQEGDYSPAERDHYAQLIRALSQWAQRAPLGDVAHARQAVPRLTLAARSTGLAGEEGLRRAGMTTSLQRLGPFARQFRGVLRDYGLDLDATLAGARITLAEQTGDRARVRLQYSLGGQPVDAFVLLERENGRWYLSDLLRRARVEAAMAPAMAKR